MGRHRPNDGRPRPSTFACPRPLRVAPLLLSLCVAALPAVADDAAPLHNRIDALVEAAAEGPVPPPATDAEFLRRVYLDLAGTIPTAEQARAFLADQSPDKRAKLIDSLLNGDHYPRRMRDLFNAMLMERRGTTPEWEAYLEKSFRENKPWDQLAREVLRGEPGEDDALAGVELFYTKRLERYGQQADDREGLVRDIGRLFLGVDLQCANCHDHLFVDDYKQLDYRGLSAFVANTVLRRDGSRTLLGENLMQSELEFASVFTKEPKTTGPRVPFGEEIEVPTFEKGEEYLVPPDKKKRTPGVPKFSPRKLLSEQLPQPDRPQFKRNAANRLWWIAMGRGIIHPLDMQHTANPPSHPELLDLLANELAAHDFNIKAFLREVTLSRAYGRTSLLPEGRAVPESSFLVALEKGLSPEQLLASMLTATGERERIEKEKKLDEVREAFLKAFANPPAEPETEFRSSVKAALFTANSDLVISWLEPRDGNLVDRLNKLEKPDALADELYLSVLTRTPTDEERTTIIDYLAKRPDDRVRAIQNLAWALLASTEFRVNH